MTELATLIVQLGLSTAIAALYCWAATRREDRHVTTAAQTDQWIRTELTAVLSQNSVLLQRVTLALNAQSATNQSVADATNRLATTIGNGACPLAQTPRP